MLDDGHDKDMMRNQLIAVILMTLLVVAWLHYFGPKPATQPAAPAPGVPGQTTDEGVSSGAEPTASATGPTPQAESSAGTEWPYLPPVATQENPAQDEVTIENAHLRVMLTRVGGRCKKVFVLLGEDGQSTIQLVPEPVEGATDLETVYPLGLRFTHEAIGDALDTRRWEVEPDRSGSAVAFSLTLPDAAVVRKRFSLSDRPYVMDVAVSYENVEAAPRILGMDQTPAYSLDWGPNVSSGDQAKMVRQTVCWYKGGALGSQETGKMKPASGALFARVIPDVDWVGIRSAYFVVAMKPEAYEGACAWMEGVPKKFRAGLSVPRFEVASATAHTAAFSVYAGPSEARSLAQAWDTLPKARRFFESVDLMDRFAKFLLGVMNWFYDHIIPNYGFAIIFVTLLVRIGMYPLTLKSMRSMKKMQLLAPEVEAVRAKYGQDAQEMNKKMMELYKERGVNPMGGCFPILLQMPVFIAFYRMLAASFELRGAPFIFWMRDLSEPDHLFHVPALAGIPLIGMFRDVNLLPILMGVAMVLSQKMMPASGPAQNPQQKFMMTFMPVFFSFICYSMASGLNLYILTSTVLGMVQQHFTGAGDVNVEPKKKTPRRRQHFYTAAIARKRQLAKEAKEERRRARLSGAASKRKGKQ